MNEHDFRDPLKRKQAFYYMASKEKNRDRIAQAKFEEPPYYMRFLDSWTTRKEEYTNESDGIRGIYESSNGYVRGTDADCGTDFARHDALE